MNTPSAIPHHDQLHIRLDRFEGPLDLLLYLIQANELDVSKIAIHKVTEQYLHSIKLMADLNFELAGEFLVMAATLIYWKSKAVLPREDDGKTDAATDDDIMTPEELVRQLLEHKRFLAAGDELAQIPRLWQDVFIRPNERPAVERVWRNMDVSDLSVSLQDALIRAKRSKRVLKKETVSIAEKILEFSDRLKVHEVTPMSDLWAMNPSRPEKVVTFLASLELARLKKLLVYQQEIYGPIYLELIESLRQFDLNLARGFDATPLTQAGAATPAPAPAESQSV